MTRLTFAVLIGLAVLAASCAPTAAPPAATSVPAAPANPPSASAYTPTPLNPPVKVSIGVVSSTSDGGIFIANERGYFKQEGIDLDVQRFQTLVDMVAPLTGGQLQIAAGGLAASLYNAVDRGVALRIVA